MKILVCTDGSRGGQASVEFAVNLFRNTAHDLTVLVFKQLPDELNRAEERIARGTRSKREKVGQERSGEEILNAVREMVADLEVPWKTFEVERGEGDLADHILTMAPDFDLVCIGGAGRGGFSQNLLGMIADRVILEGSGNLMVTKRVSRPCRRVLLAVRRESVSRNLLGWMGALFSGTDVELTLWVLAPRVLKRFEGYMEAGSGKRLRQAVEEELQPEEQRLTDLAEEVLAEHEVRAEMKLRIGGSFTEMIDQIEANVYDLVMIHPPFDPPGLLQDLEPGKQALGLLRKIPANVFLFRSLPAGTGDIEMEEVERGDAETGDAES